MSGKPSAAPARPAAARPAAKPPAKVPAKAAAPKRQAPSRKVGETVADEDDPFGIDTSSVAQVPKMAPKPAKGRMLRIVCPMCETPGFISPKMQGRDVKCCNPQCMVPVFKAPLPPKKGQETDEKRGGPSGKTLGIAAVVVLLIGGLIFWGFVYRRWSGENPQAGPTAKTYKYDDRLTGGNPAQLEQPGAGSVAPQVAGSQTLSLAEIKKQALAKIITSAQVRDDNRKAYGRRLAAEAHAQAGDLKVAQEQLKHLRNVGRRVPYFQVEPLLLVAWEQLRRGDADAATQTIQQAHEAYTGLTEVGREVLSAGIALATAQAAFDHVPEAKATLKTLEAERERARVAALIQIVSDLETFDLDELLNYSSLDLAIDPLALATTTDVASHGYWEKAIAWALAQSDTAAKEDSLSALGTFAARRAAQTGDGGPLDRMAAIPNLSATGQARLLAGIATGHLMTGNQPDAEAALAEALTIFETIPRPAAIATPDLKAIHDSDGKRNAGLPDASPMRSSAVAAAQLARLQVLLGQSDEGWTTLLKAWEFTAGMAPAFGPISKLSQEVENNRVRLQSRLNRDLNVRNDRDAQFRAMLKFRGQLRVLEQAARDRFELETALLREASAWGLGSKVESLRKNPGSVVAVAADQPYQEAGRGDALTQLLAETETLFAAGKFQDAAELLASFKDRHIVEQRRDQRALQLACRLLKQKKIDALFAFADTLEDPWLVEDCLEMTAALGVKTGQAPELWRRSERQGLEAAERVAFYRGLVAGIVSTERRKPPQQTAAAGR